MLLKLITYILIVTPALASAEARSRLGERAPVSLCRALERVGPGDQIVVEVSGIYGINYLYDPEEPACGLDVGRSACVEFSPELEVPHEFSAIHKRSLRIFATFRGVLYGPKQDPQASNPLIPVNARLAASNSSRFCASQYRTKLVVFSILGFKEVPDELPWSEPSQRETTNRPLPVGMELPAYPWKARNLHAVGSVLLEVRIVDGKVVDARIQFGDPVLAEEALANVKTWRFEQSLNDAFTVEYEFQLEKRPASEGTNPEFEMRLPSYVKVVGAQRNW